MSSVTKLESFFSNRGFNVTDVRTNISLFHKVFNDLISIFALQDVTEVVIYGFMLSIKDKKVGAHADMSDNKTPTYYKHLLTY